VNGYLRAFDVLEDAIVGGRFSPRIVFRLQAVDGNHDIQVLEGHPRRWNHPECAGDNLGICAAALNLRQQRVEFAIADERIATHKRDMHRSVLVDQSKHPRDQDVSTKVGEIAKLCLATQMRPIERVASRAPQGALFRDFNRKRRSATGQNAGPRTENLRCFHDLSDKD